MEVKSPEKSEAMEFIGLHLVRCKIMLENKCLQQVKTLNISVVKFPSKMKRIIKKTLAKFFQILGILNNTLIPNLVEKYSRIKVYNALAVPSLL